MENGMQVVMACWLLQCTPEEEEEEEEERPWMNDSFSFMRKEHTANGRAVEAAGCVGPPSLPMQVGHVGSCLCALRLIPCIYRSSIY
jgi:hypothetical protein